MKANLANPMSEIERSAELEEVQFRVSLLRLVGEQSEPLEEIVSVLSPAA